MEKNTHIATLTDESITLLKEMIAIPSPSFNEDEVCSHICQWLSSKGIEHERVDNNIIAGIKDYTQRLSHFAQFDIEIIPELKNAKKLSEAQQKEAESELILKALQAGDRVVLLDEGGKEFRSTEFAAWLEHKQNISTKRLVFIVGGPYGFAPKVYEAAHEKLSLSKMTFSHQMIRLLFVEQLYRAYTIINHLPYHHN